MWLPHRQDLPRLLLRAITAPQCSPCVLLCVPIQDLAIAIAMVSRKGCEPQNPLSQRLQFDGWDLFQEGS